MKRPLTPPNGRFSNYMYYRGGTLRFGKLTMVDGDLVLVDANQKDPFDFSPEEYTIAGSRFSKNTRSHGLVVYMPDLSDLSHRSAQSTAKVRRRSTPDRPRHGELDVLAHGVPDRAVFLARQGDRPLDAVVSHVAFNGEMQRQGNDAMRIVIPARFASRCARNARYGQRPFERMCAKSIAMHPPSANASACTGDGPATPALSSVIDARSLVPENLRWQIQVRSRTVGGFGTA